MLTITPTVLPDGYVAQIEGGMYPFECHSACPLHAAWYAIRAEIMWRIHSRA